MLRLKHRCSGGPGLRRTAGGGLVLRQLSTNRLTVRLPPRYPNAWTSACRNAAMLQPSCQTLNVIWSKSIEPTPSLYGRTPQIRGGADFEEFAHRRALEA